MLSELNLTEEYLNRPLQRVMQGSCILLLLHCSDIISPLSLPVTQLAEGIAVLMGIQVTANTTRMKQNKGEEETGGEKIELRV